MRVGSLEGSSIVVSDTVAAARDGDRSRGREGFYTTEIPLILIRNAAVASHPIVVLVSRLVFPKDQTHRFAQSPHASDHQTGLGILQSCTQHAHGPSRVGLI